MRNNFCGLIVALSFFVVSVFTLSDYGINVDEPAHFIRGQAYAEFLLTGRKTYLAKDLESSRVSAWKLPLYDGYFYMERDTGHPPLNGILAALTNRVFYEKFGIFGDLESYHLFEVFVSSLLVLLVYVFTSRHYGQFAGVIAALSISLYPLFFGESHFNIKDPVETTFYAFTLYFFYWGLEKNQGRFFLASSLFFALALGTKFNILFLIPTIFLYLVISHYPIKRISIQVWVSLIAYPVIVLTIYFLTRPYFWADPIGRFFETYQYYHEMGTGGFSDSRFLIGKWNTYPLVFVIVSTPLVILFYSLVGIISGLLGERKDRKKFSIMIFLWLTIPIVRVSLPGMSIYSGVRQIMEYIPAMAIFAGRGALAVKELLPKRIGDGFSNALILASFVPLLLTLIRLHPNENVFINSLVGGLSGAVEKRIPGAGESMGNVYLQGIWWLNENAPDDAHFGLPVGLKSNVPDQYLERGIGVGPYFSGMSRDGEYMMEKISVGQPINPNLYNFAYLERFLDPVYEVKVDGVTLLKIWQNDDAHTRSGFISEEEINYHMTIDENKDFRFDFDKPRQLTRLEIDHSSYNCELDAKGVISYSADGASGIISGDLYSLQGPYASSLRTNSHHVYFFAAEEAKWVKVSISTKNSCIARIDQVKIFGLENIKSE